MTALSDDPPWDLPVEGFQVARLDFGYPLYLIAAADEGRRFRLGLNGQFAYRDADGSEHLFDAEQDPWDQWMPMFALRADVIGRAHVSRNYVLRIEFASSRSIVVKPTGDGYQAWEISGSAVEFFEA